MRSFSHLGSLYAIIDNLGPNPYYKEPRGYTLADEAWIARRTDELAHESFDKSDQRMRDWLADECEPDVASVILRALEARHGDHELDGTITRLRDRYVRMHRDLIRVEVEHAFLQGERI